MAENSKSYLDLARECDSLPYPDQVEEYRLLTSTFYRFCLKETWDEEPSALVTIGYMLPSVIAQMPWNGKRFRIDHGSKTVTIPYAPGTDVETAAIGEQLASARADSSFDLLRQWRGEHYQVLGLDRDVRMARGGVALFGIHTVGVHVMAFCRTGPVAGGGTGMMGLWIPRRAATKQTYPGMLDNTVGGAIVAGESQLDCMVRETEEEASLPKGLTRRLARPVGAISYFHMRDARAGGEVGLLQPATHHLYDLELGADVVPKPKDGEVEAFYLWGVEETVAALKEGRFKPNSAVAWIDFLIRHGYINAQNEPDYLELVSRIHRRIRF